MVKIFLQEIPERSGCFRRFHSQILLKNMRFRPWPKSGSPQPPDAEGCIGPPAASDTSSAGHGLTNGGRAYIPDNLYTILASPSKASFPRRQKVSFRARGTTRGNH